MTTLEAPGQGSAGMGRVFAMMLVCSFLWATAFPLMKVIGATIDPVALTALRGVMGSLILGAFLVARGQRPWPRGREWRDWAVLGLLAVFGAMLLIAVMAVLFDQSSGPASQLLIPVVAVAMIWGAWWLYGFARRAEGGVRIGAWILLAILGIAGAIFAFGTIFAALHLGAFAVLTPLVMLPVAITAFRWMYAPTPEGRAVMDRIAGFKQYLGITEEHRLDTLHPPEKTPDLFEKYLPHAIALEVENRWADKFAGVLAAAAAAGTAAHTATWYSGSGNVWDDPRGFADTVGSSLDSTVSSAATSPSSGGSSGGGSSGGGGGGGGGGGW